MGEFSVWRPRAPFGRHYREAVPTACPWAPSGRHRCPNGARGRHLGATLQPKNQLREFRVSTPYISFLTPPNLSPSPICTKIRWLCLGSLKISQTHSSHFHFHDISPQIFHIFSIISISSSIFTNLLLLFIPYHENHLLGRFWMKFLYSFHERLSS